MGSILNLSLPCPTSFHRISRRVNHDESWTSLQSKLKCNGRVSCLFSDNRREELARKALESALGGKKNEFEKWSKEIKKREEVGGGAGGGGKGWFGWGGWSGDEHFWQDAQQTTLTVVAIVVIYFVVAKGELLLAVVLNPLLYTLRGTRNLLPFIASRMLRTSSPNRNPELRAFSSKEVSDDASAKERVASKWGSG